MAEIENAQMLLGLAQNDLAAMLALKDAEDVTDQIFGFHAQQAVEKSLKAWLSTLGVPYPFTHSLVTLFGLIEDEVGAEEIARFRDLDLLDPYAVQLRYSAYEEPEDELDRAGMIREVDSLLRRVREAME